MEVDGIPFKHTGYFSNLIADYLEEKEWLSPFYENLPHIDQFAKQIKAKQSFPQAHREVLHLVLTDQYKEVDSSQGTKDNIALLKESNTYTVVTGHQLNLFTGPLYFLYKIISTINLTKELKQAYPNANFVPVYWMATEDHDFDEINYFNFKGKKLQWSKQVSGAVGPLETEGLAALLEAFSHEMSNSVNAKTLKRWFTQAYLEHDTLADATRFLANTLFGDYGLVILDGNNVQLKRLMAPYVRQDLLENTSYKKVKETITQLEALPEKYSIQVNPREINYFYLGNNMRERIVERAGIFYVNNTSLVFSRDEMLAELEQFPERFSPNVITRPLYQEVILPNLCYIGGGGELAYWLQLKAMFLEMKVAFPILLLRNSALVITEKQQEKLQRLKISVADLFLKQNSLINKKIREISNIDIDFSFQKKHLEEQFKALHTLAAQTDASFLGAVKAQEIKQIKGLDYLEKRLLKAQKIKLQDHILRMTEIQNQLFPQQSLQERNLNFSELYLAYGEQLIPYLMKALKPLSKTFSIVKMDGY